MNRRTFFRKTFNEVVATFGAPLVLSGSVIGKNRSVSPNNKIAVGFIGTGNNGTNWLKHFFKDDRVRVVAVCDVEPNRREAAQKTVHDRYAKQRETGTFKGCDTYGDFRELLARDDIDAVVISTPDHWHAITTIESCRAGKDVFCEKPLTLKLADTKAAQIKSDTTDGQVTVSG